MLVRGCWRRWRAALSVVFFLCAWPLCAFGVDPEPTHCALAYQFLRVFTGPIFRNDLEAGGFSASDTDAIWSQVMVTARPFTVATIRDTLKQLGPSFFEGSRDRQRVLGAMSEILWFTTDIQADHLADMIIKIPDDLEMIRIFQRARSLMDTRPVPWHALALELSLRESPLSARLKQVLVQNLPARLSKRLSFAEASTQISARLRALRQVFDGNQPAQQGGIWTSEARRVVSTARDFYRSLLNGYETWLTIERMSYDTGDYTQASTLQKLLHESGDAVDGAIDGLRGWGFSEPADELDRYIKAVRFLREYPRGWP